MAISVDLGFRKVCRDLPWSLESLQSLQLKVAEKKQFYAPELDPNQTKRAEAYIVSSPWQQRWMRATFCPFKTIPDWWPTRLRERSNVLGWARRTQAERLERALVSYQRSVEPVIEALTDPILTTPRIELTPSRKNFLRSSHQLILTDREKRQHLVETVSLSCRALVSLDPDFNTTGSELLNAFSGCVESFKDATTRFQSVFPLANLIDMSFLGDYSYKQHGENRAQPKVDQKVKDAFNYFGLSEATATKIEVQKIYKMRALQYHPDRSGTDASRFQELGQHYAVLTSHFDTAAQFAKASAFSTSTSFPGKNCYGTFNRNTKADKSKFEPEEAPIFQASASASAFKVA
ncbi:MAG: DnaJ domain-containing protein [Gammaproteobacteria bacterium]